GVDIVCDHSYRHWSKSTKQCWFFQYSKSRLVIWIAYQIRFVDYNHKEDIHNLRAPYRQVNDQWIFDEIDIERAVSELVQKDKDTDHDINKKTNSKRAHFFDQDENMICVKASIRQRTLYLSKFQDVCEEFLSNITKARLPNCEAASIEFNIK
ncbi:hypothetical protein RFI_39263, partial [Reticulomyxa filosa]